MNEPELHIRCDRLGKGGKVRLKAKLGEKAILTDELKITCLRDRELFLNELTKRHLGVSKSEVRDLLERLADENSSRDHRESPLDEFVSTPRYRSSKRGLIWEKEKGDDVIPILMANFTAQIVAEVIHDNGVDTTRVFEIRAKVGGSTSHFDIPANRFHSMNWVTEHLGSKAIVYAGFSLKDHARTAIQVQSGDVESRHVYIHTGWRKLEEDWAFIHADGAIGPNGPLTQIGVQISDSLSSMALPEPPAGAEEVVAIQASLSLLDLGPDHIMFPLLAAAFRATLGDADFALHVAGATGVFKTEIVALFQSFFGKDLNARNLPGSWSSTENAIEALGFLAKDVLLVVDDFAPHGTSHDIHRFHKKADRVIRSQGNKSGRSRCRSDGTIIKSMAPRCLFLSTGEDIPAGQSLRARMLILELSDGDIAKERLTECQLASHEGLYAATTAGFLQWTARQYMDLQKRLKVEVPVLRTQASQDDQHRRTPAIISQLYFGIGVFLEYAVDAGGIDREQAEKYQDRCWQALGQAAVAQNQHQTATEPTETFIRLINAALASGEAHIADINGVVPVDQHPESLGWRKQSARTELGDDVWFSQGARIGWIEDDSVFLIPEASFKAAQRAATDTERIPINRNTLAKRLSEKGLLRTFDPGRSTIRKLLQGTRQRVLHFERGTLLKAVQSVQSVQAIDNSQQDKDLHHDGKSTNTRSRSGVDQKAVPDTGLEPTLVSPPANIRGPNGPIGPLFTPYPPKSSELFDGSPRADQDPDNEEKVWDL
jgi:hypothetical protein